MKAVDAYIAKNRERFISELCELLRIPSVSPDTKHQGDMKEAADFLKNALNEAGASTVKVMQTGGHPAVYAEKVVNPKLPTVLVYGHYDVQPPEPLDEWKTPPFEPSIRGGKVYARGAMDDKGQMYAHVKAFEAMVATQTLPCNVKFLIEGEEEIGSPSLPRFCRENKKLLKSDVVLVSDSPMISNTQPSINVGLRGICYFEIRVRGPKSDLHSGLHGGAVANPANTLTKMIASLHDKKGRVAIPGFYDDVVRIPAHERAALKKQPFSETTYKKTLGVRELFGERGYSTLERIGIRPTLDVHGLWGGYTGSGGKTIIPSSAHAKVSMRLVPHQDPKVIARLFKRHIQEIAPPSVRVEVTQLEGFGEPYVMDTKTPEYIAAARALTETFGKVPIPTRLGGSIPVVATFKKVLGIDTVLMGFGLETDNLHAPNEHFGLFNYKKAIETIPRFYRYYAETKR